MLLMPGKVANVVRIAVAYSFHQITLNCVGQFTILYWKSKFIPILNALLESVLFGKRVSPLNFTSISKILIISFVQSPGTNQRNNQVSMKMNLHFHKLCVSLQRRLCWETGIAFFISRKSRSRFSFQVYHQPLW